LFSVGWSGVLHRRGDDVLNFLQELEVCFQSDDRVFCFADRGEALSEETFFEIFFLREFEVFSPSHDDPVLSHFKRVRDVLLRALWMRERERELGVIVCLGVSDSRVFFLCIPVFSL